MLNILVENTFRDSPYVVYQVGGDDLVARRLQRTSTISKQLEENFIFENQDVKKYYREANYSRSIEIVSTLFGNFY